MTQVTLNFYSLDTQTRYNGLQHSLALLRKEQPYLPKQVGSRLESILKEKEHFVKKYMQEYIDESNRFSRLKYSQKLIEESKDKAAKAMIKVIDQLKFIADFCYINHISFTSVGPLQMCMYNSAGEVIPLSIGDAVKVMMGMIKDVSYDTVNLAGKNGKNDIITLYMLHILFDMQAGKIKERFDSAKLLFEERERAGFTEKELKKYHTAWRRSLDEYTSLSLVSLKIKKYLFPTGFEPSQEEVSKNKKHETQSKHFVI